MQKEEDGNRAEYFGRISCCKAVNAMRKGAYNNSSGHTAECQIK